MPQIRNQAHAYNRKIVANSPTPMCRGIEIGLIIVNYNSERSTARLLADLLRQDLCGCTLTVVIADNSTTKTGLAFLQHTYRDRPGIRFETMTTNLGYFGAAHYIVNNLWKEQLPDWVIVSNADIRLPESNFFLRIADCSPKISAVIAPRIVSTQTGLDQNPFHKCRPSAFRVNLNRIIPRSLPLFWLMQTQCSIRRAIRSWLRAPRSIAKTSSSNIYAPHGAFVIFNEQYFRRGGNLACGAFLFAEELFVAETCRRLGLRVTYLPSLEVLHDEHISTATNPAIRRFQAASADYCARHFFAYHGPLSTLEGIVEWFSQSLQ
jgi:GT2 family glycosyltransferase